MKIISKVLCILVLLLHSTTLLAQQKLDEVYVVDLKKTEKIANSNKSITIIDSTELDKYVGKTLYDILNNQQGITINGGNMSRGSAVSISIQGSDNGNVLFLLDGVPLYDPTNISSSFDINMIDMSDIDRIEIMYGGQSVLFGSNATAGAINLISKKTKDDMSISGMVSFGNYDEAKQSISLSGKIDKFEYSTSYFNETANGMSSAKDPTGDNNYEKDDYNAQKINLNLGYIDDKIEFRPFIRYSEIENEFDYGSFMDDADSKGSSNEINTGFTSLYKINNKTNLYFNYNYSRIHRTFSNDSISGIKEYSTTNWDGSLHQADLYTKIYLNQKISLISGVNFKQSSNEQENYYKGWGYESTTKLDADSSKYTTVAPYLMLYIADIYGFNFDIGDRVNYHSIYGINNSFSFLTSYYIKDKVKLYADISSSFKEPSLYQIYDPYYGNNKLEPETSLSYELGTAFNLNNIKFDIKGFLRNTDNVIIYSNNSHQNFNKQKAYGLDVNANTKLFDMFTLNMAYCYTNGSTDDEDFLIRIPKNVFITNIGYNINEKLYISTNLKVNGSYYDSYYDYADFTTKTIKLDSYVVLNAYSEYKITNKIKVFIDLKNITNTDYVEMYGYTTKGFNFNTGLVVNN